MTYKQIKQQFPSEYEARQTNKLFYRYPGMGGESYVDVIQRVNHVIVELERMTASVLIITHQALMRTLLAYMLDTPLAMMPNTVVPLNQLYCIEPQPYGNKVTLYQYDPVSGTFTPP
jgi:6-phosphofructo-2-kinase